MQGVLGGWDKSEHVLNCQSREKKMDMFLEILDGSSQYLVKFP